MLVKSKNSRIKRARCWNFSDSLRACTFVYVSEMSEMMRFSKMMFEMTTAKTK